MVHHTRRLPIGNNVTSLFVFGDRQQGSSGYSKEAWQEFKHEFQTTKNAYALGVGDYGDWLRPSMRTPVITALAKDDDARQMLENDIRKAHNEIIDDMEFLKGKLIGLHEGHHNWTFQSGENTDQRLASALEAPYLGWIASTRLILEIGKANKHTHVHTMISTHGNANGRKVASALQYLENNYMASWIADSYVMGHGCKSGNHVPFKRNLIRRVGPAGIDAQIPRSLIVGGFAEGFTDGWKSSYVERAGFAAQPLGYGIIRFKLVQRQDGTRAPGTNSLQVEVVNRVLDC